MYLVIHLNKQFVTGLHLWIYFRAENTPEEFEYVNI